MVSKIEEALELLSKNWKIEPIILDFILGKKTDVADFQVKVNDVIFHIPYLRDENVALHFWQGDGRHNRSCSHACP